VQASGVGEGNEGRANYLVQKNRALATMAQFGLVPRGISGRDAEAYMATADESKSKHKNVGVIGRSMKHILKGLASGKHLPKYQGKLKRLGRRINALGLDDKQIKRLTHLQEMTGDITRLEEFASNASTLTTQDEEGHVTQGVFKGHTEGFWLNEQLAALLKLRGAVVREYHSEAPHLPQVKHLLKEVHARLRAVKKAIRDAEREKQAFERQIKAIEKAEHAKKHQLEKEVNELEHTIAEARRHVPPGDKKHKAAHEAAEAHINELEKVKEAKQKALSHSGADSTKEIREANEKIHKIDADQKNRKRVEEALSGTILPALTSKKSSLSQLLEGIKGEAGEVEGKGHHFSFSGLGAIQGAGTGMGNIGNPPPLGTVGGQIFAVQNRLREIQEEEKKAPTTPETQGEEEKLNLEKELRMDWMKQYIVSQYQYKTLKAFPSVSAINAMPFAGSYAKGGVVMAEVGEKGREIIAAPQGSRVLSKHEVDTAVRGQSGVTLNFEEVHFHEDSGKVSGRVNGQDFEHEAEIRKVTRKETSRSMASTPGGQGLKGRRGF
jgi:hypothetical protein